MVGTVAIKKKKRVYNRKVPKTIQKEEIKDTLVSLQDDNNNFDGKKEIKEKTDTKKSEYFEEISSNIKCEVFLCGLNSRLERQMKGINLKNESINILKCINGLKQMVSN